MANKEALKDLQSRLADRLQQARTSPQSTQSWLAVECRGLGVLLPLDQAGEIHGHVQPTAVPHTRAWFAGVSNLRGGLYGVVDLGAYLGIDARADAVPMRDQARLVALNPSFGLNCAVMIDRLAGLKRADQLQRVESDEAAMPRPPFAGDRWVDGDGRAWQEIKLAELAADEQFLAIAQA
jgi:twitching motility protein PilI